MIYGGFWLRVVAFVIDYFVLIIAQTLIYMVFGFGFSDVFEFDMEGTQMFGSVAGIVAYTITIVGSILYYVWMESSSKQATLGKMALGMVVTDTEGRRISFWRAFGRYFAKILSAMVLLIGYIMVAFTDRKQGLHDVVCSTLVLRGKPGETSVDPSIFD